MHGRGQGDIKNAQGEGGGASGGMASTIGGYIPTSDSRSHFAGIGTIIRERPPNKEERVYLSGIDSTIGAISMTSKSGIIS